MGCPDIGDHGDVRRGDLREAPDLPEVVHAHLEDHDLVLCREAEDRHRQSDIIVEISGGRVDPEMPGQNGGDHLTAGRLAYTACDPDHFDIIFHPVIVGQVSQGVPGILH